MKNDEMVTFFPTFAARSTDGKSWNVHLHAWVYELEENSLSRRALLHLLTKRLGLTEDVEATQLFQERARLFLVDNERGKNLGFRLGEHRFAIGPSGSNGHIQETVSIPVDRVVVPSDGLVSLALEGQTVPGRESSVSVQFIGEEGFSVISDLDDTIKESEVHNRKALLLNTFCKEFRPVSGMAELYRSWAQQGVVFHYVSASPSQLFPAIGSFLERHGFPQGSVSLKLFRWKDSSFFDLFVKNDGIKAPMIEGILRAFPKRTFLLVGDTGELDPELYGRMARQYPQQIERVLIRNSTGESVSSERLNAAFHTIPKERWIIFSDPEELKSLSVTQFPVRKE